jgi:hypothetical protein
MNYVWDGRKSRTNLKRHGIAFEDAIGIFDGPTLAQVDDRFGYVSRIRRNSGLCGGMANCLEITLI